jgi:hypothetical protein
MSKVMLVILMMFFTLQSPHQVHANPANKKLLGLSERDRAVTLAYFLRASGEKCPKATRVFYQGESKRFGTASWSVTCSNGESWSIGVNDDREGSTKILNCRVLKAIAKVDCFSR